MDDDCGAIFGANFVVFFAKIKSQLVYVWFAMISSLAVPLAA